MISYKNKCESIAWQKAYGGDGSYNTAIQQTADGGYVAAGITPQVPPSAPVDWQVIKLNSYGACPPFDNNTTATVTNTPAVTIDTTVTGGLTGPNVTNTAATATDTNLTTNQQAP